MGGNDTFHISAVRAGLVGTMSLARFALRRNGTYGAAIATEATVDLRDGLIDEHEFGARVAVSNYEAGRRDNYVPAQ